MRTLTCSPRMCDANPKRNFWNQDDKAKSSHLPEPLVPEATGEQPSHASHAGDACSEPVPPTWSLQAGLGEGEGEKKKKEAGCHGNREAGFPHLPLSQLPGEVPWQKPTTNLEDLNDTVPRFSPYSCCPTASPEYICPPRLRGPSPRRSRAAEHLNFVLVFCGTKGPSPLDSRIYQTGMGERPELDYGDEVLQKTSGEGGASAPSPPHPQ